MEYTREIFYKIKKRLGEDRRFIQILAGPRQVGKTTLAKKLLQSLKTPTVYASADDPALKGKIWIEDHWGKARAQLSNKPVLLVLDEVHKVKGWSETVKKLWDEDSFNNRDLKVLLLGSAPLSISKGLSDSLAGRFEITQVPHWSFSEMHSAFNWSLEQYIFFGGYPGSAPLVIDIKRWKDYVRNALIETTLSRDILLIERIDKPALLRQLFQLACSYSGKILSYDKMLGQLQDAGNTTTIAHYLKLLEQAFLVCGLSKFSGSAARKRASSPKLALYNTALLSSGLEDSFDTTRANTILWGQLVESAVGAHLLNSASIADFSVYYWREGDNEVDFVLTAGDSIVSVEVKSGTRDRSQRGRNRFAMRYPNSSTLLVGADGMPIEDFLKLDIATLL